MNNYPPGVTGNEVEIAGDGGRYEKWLEDKERYDLAEFVAGFLAEHSDFWVDSAEKDELTKCVLDFVYELHPNEFTDFLKANWHMLIEEYSDMPLQFVSERWDAFVAWADRTRIVSFTFLGRQTYRTALQGFYSEIEGTKLFEKYIQSEYEKDEDAE